MTPSQIVELIRATPASERHEILVEVLHEISVEQLLVAIEEVYDEEEIFGMVTSIESTGAERANTRPPREDT